MIKKTLLLTLAAVLFWPALAFGQLSTCTVSGIAYGLNGQPAAGVKIRVVRVERSGTLIQRGNYEVTTGADGSWTMTLPRSSMAYFCSQGAPLGAMSGDCSNPSRKIIPNESTALYGELLPAQTVLNTPLTFTVQDEGIPLPGSIATVNFVGSGVAASQSGTGLATVTINGGGGGGGSLTVADSSGTPSVSDVDTIRVDGTDGVILTSPAAGRALIRLSGVPWARISKTGSSLADLSTRSASDLSSGTLPDGRFPATLPAASGVNLTALNASNLGSGTVPLARLSGITDAELSASAGIALSKLAALTANRALVSNGSGAIAAASVTSTELGYLAGVSGGLQSQIDGKAAASHSHAAADISSGALALARGGTGADLSASGPGFVKQGTTGGALSVGSIAAGDIPSGVDAAKIADGSVSNAELQRLDGVTSAIQGQIDGKQAASGELTALAALSPSNDDIIQRKAGAWAARSMAQLKTDLSLTKGDVGLGNVENTALSTWAGSSSITTVGTISSGTWSGSVIGATKGGAGTVSGILKANGSGTVSAASAGTDYVPPGAIGSSGLTMATARLLGRSTASSGAVEEITIGSGLSLSGGTLSATGGGGGGSGTVTSVALSMPAEFSVSGSPVTDSGTLTVSKANQSANRVYAGPVSGGAAAPSFRLLVEADIPDLSTSYAQILHEHNGGDDITAGQVRPAYGGTGSDLSATGPGFLKQASTGANVTVAAIAAGDIPSGVDAAKIGDGSVSNAEFQALDGVSGTIATLAGSGTFTNKTIDAEGTGNLITLPFRTYFPAAGCNNATAGPVLNLPTSNAPTASCVTGTNRQKGILSFPDSDGDFSAQAETLLPADWTGALDVKIRWYSAATSGDAVWQVQTSCVADGETDDPSWNTASTVTDTAKGSANQMNDATISGVTATGCAAGEMLNLRILRNRTHASDTITGAIVLVGLEVTIRRGI